MRVRFHGTRGSIATPGERTLRYGGNTSCVEVRSDAGTLLVLDCGTGAFELGRRLVATAKGPLRGHILVSHTHWDHIQGLPFFAPLFVPDGEWDIYGPRGLGGALHDTLSGQMQHTYFPVALDQLGATIRYHDLVEGSFDIADVRVHAQYLNHTSLTLGYRLEADGAVMVYACDHEPHSRDLAVGLGQIGAQDAQHAEFLAGADLVIHDAQYTVAEYPAKTGWGHSTADYAVKIAEAADVKRLAFTHHDPLRDDVAVDRMVGQAADGLEGRSSRMAVLAAAEGETIELRGSTGRRARETSATLPIAEGRIERSVVYGTGSSMPTAAVLDALRADGVRIVTATDAAAALEAVAAVQPALVLLDRSMDDGGDGLAACGAIRARGDAYAAEVPIVLLADREDAEAGQAAGATDWLVQPFSPHYARARAQAWLMRVACRWVRAPIPVDEEKRLAALRDLEVLDTPPEERFDRLTRIAAALFEMPITLVSLVDENRQWMKSTCGTDIRETPRDVSFCAHAVANRDVLVVPDAKLDPRFADNPVVAGPPGVRFYAGHPVYTPDGSCVGTLCLLDTRPRHFPETSIALLRDMAGLVAKELLAPRAA